MTILKKYGLLAGKFILLFFISAITLSIMNYFFLPSKTTYIFGLVFLIIVFFVLSFKEAKNSSSRGIITGLKTGAFLILLLIIFNLLFFQSSFKLLRFIYYLILLFSSLFGAIVGINTKKNE